MTTQHLHDALAGNEYPGRGIVLGMDEAGEHMVIAYFIMGRSENSRNRIFQEKDGGIITKAYDESKMVDPSLIIYAPVRTLGDTTIVTNGDQTDTVYDFLAQGKTFEEALRTRTFEPDAPNFTPRISGLLTLTGDKASYKLSILKSDENDPAYPRRYFFEYEAPRSGIGHFIHTYRCNGQPIPSFEGEPERVTLAGDVDTLTQSIWAGLNEDNKVSLFVRFISLKDHTEQTRIVNKHCC